MMIRGLEFHGEWDNKKRKNSVLDSLNNSSNDEWDSSSCTAPALKQRKSQLDWQSGGGEEVGNDDIQFMGREIFEPTTCIGLEKKRIDEGGLQCQKDVVVEIENHLETTEIEGKQWSGVRNGQKIYKEPLTLDGNRNCMLTIMSELKETRGKMLMWLQQEVQKIMNEGSGGVRIGLGGQAGGEMEFEEQHFSGPNANSTGMTVVGNGSGEIDFGGETSGSGGTGLARQNNLVDGTDYTVRNGNTDLNFGTQNCDTGRDDIGFGKENGSTGRMGSGFGGQKNSGQADAGMGGSSNSEGGIDFDNENRGAPGGGVLAMTLQNGSADIVHIGSQGARDAVVGFRTSNVLPGEMAFRAEQTNCGIGLNYGNHASGGSGMVFGRQGFDSGTQDSARGRGGVAIRSAVGAVNSQTPVISAHNRQVNAMQISGEERTPDLFGSFGMHSQSLHTSVPSSMMWNGVMPNPRDASQGISDSGLHGIHFDTHNRLGNRVISPYRDLVSSGSAYENSTGMMNLPAIQVTASNLGMHLPMSMQNLTQGGLNSSCMQPFLGMQNQAATQNFVGMQNFLGLSMNGNMCPVSPVLEEGTSTHVFPGLYHNDHARHILTAKSNALPGSSGMRGMPHKSGGTVSRMDKLELNT